MAKTREATLELVRSRLHSAAHSRRDAGDRRDWDGATEAEAQERILQWVLDELLKEVESNSMPLVFEENITFDQNVTFMGDVFVKGNCICEGTFTTTNLGTG